MRANRGARTSQARQPARPVASDDDDFILPIHAVRTTFRMQELKECDRVAVFHHVQQHVLAHESAAHVDSAYPYGPPNVDEFHVTAQRWDGLVPAICAVMADVLGRPVKYRIGNESLIVKPPTNSFPVPLSVTVVQRVHGSADLHRGACSCDGCYSPRSSISSGSSCTIGRSTASADDDIADDDRGAGSSGSTPSRASQESSGGKRSRRSKPRSFFAFGGDNRLSQRRTRARAHEPTSQDDTSSTLSPPPASPHSPASSTSLAASQTPPTSYLSPHLASTLKSSPPAATA